MRQNRVRHPEGAATLPAHQRPAKDDRHSRPHGAAITRRDFSHRASLIKFLLLSLTAAACSGPRYVAAQDYPVSPVRMIIPYPAGSTIDVLARLIASRLEAQLGQPVVPENQARLKGRAGNQLVAGSLPDGYTIGLAQTSSLAVDSRHDKNLAYDAHKELAYVNCVGTMPLVLEVNRDLPVVTLGELVTYAKAHPGRLNFGSAGVGDPAYVATELLKHETGIDMVHIPYKRDALAMIDLIAGRIQVLVDPVPLSLLQIRGHRVRALAVTSKDRLADLPDVPTVAESGYPAYELVESYAMVAPAGTPARIVDQLNAEISQALRDPIVSSRFSVQGIARNESNAEECARFMRGELAAWDQRLREFEIERE